MGKIRFLPETVINQIAAGEVVERPASVVKELVENSLDAQATRIRVELEEGGKKKIRVIDDGEGMSPQDAKLALKRHTTSKITHENDLLRLRTLGFRGEALSSIASVAKITLKTKTRAAQIGTLVTNTSGKLTSQPIGVPQGTEIIVTDLFYNVPARKKFLKTTRTEMQHLTKTLVNLALAHPQVEFVLEHNGKEILTARPSLKAKTQTEALRERIGQLLGSSFLEQMQPVLLDHPHLKISGWISQPGYGASHTKDQYLFVNRRCVSDKVVYGAVKKALSGVLGRGEQPRFLLFLQIHPEMVDVNVHPRKEEVRFRNEAQVFRLVWQAIQRSLPDKTGLETQTAFPKKIESTRENFPQTLKDLPTSTNLYSTPASSFRQATRADSYKYLQPPNFSPEVIDEGWLGVREDDFVVLQIDNCYLVTQDAQTGNLVIYDQHALHERILYEKLLQNLEQESRKGNSQQLLIAQTLSLSPGDLESFLKNKKDLQKIGFEIEEFGNHTLKINAIPTVLQKQNPAHLLKELLDTLADLTPPSAGYNSLTRKLNWKTHQLLATLACRSAIKAGDRLAPNQAKQLLDQLAHLQTDLNTLNLPPRSSTCPHGRPVRVTFTSQELAKLFRRR